MLVRFALWAPGINTGLICEDQLRVVHAFEIHPIMVELARVEDPLKYSKYLKKLLGQFTYVGTVRYKDKCPPDKPPPPQQYVTRTLNHPDQMSLDKKQYPRQDVA
jgi:hypothetical protein